MTTQDEKPENSQGDAKTQLRPAAVDWMLKPKDPKQEGQAFPVRGELLIGREGCDITLTSQHSSRKHAKVLLAEGVLRVEDLGSANGTFVNEERVEVSELEPGDEVRFDTEVFLVDGPAAKKPAEEDTGDDSRTVLRPAAPDKQPEPGKKAEAEKKVEPEKKPDAPAEPEPEPEESDRKAWYERETPNMTRKVESGDLRDQFAEGATQIVRGVEDIEMPSLIGTSGDWSGRVISLEKEAMTIGRSGTDVVLDEPSVSTKHAQIVRDGERWKIVDLMSANGVYVNGKKTQVAFLSPGDAVRFGRLEMRFVTDTTQVSSRAAPDQDEIITGSAGTSGKNESWLYLAIGFVVIIIAAGAYLFFAA